MMFQELFLEVRSSEIKDLEFGELLSSVRDRYEAFIATGENNPHRAETTKRAESMSFMINPNDLIEIVNAPKATSGIDYACEFNPSQKAAIHLLLDVLSATQKGAYVRGFFALYIWRSLLPEARFYSVGMTDKFYSLAEEQNSKGEYVFKPAAKIAESIKAQQQTEFFTMGENDHCEEILLLIAEIDKALDFILNRYN